MAFMGAREEWDAALHELRERHRRASAAETFRGYMNGTVTAAECLAILRLIDEARAQEGGTA